MSENDDSEAGTHKRRKRRRRSLRVPVDEVPRPTQSAEVALDGADGSSTIEMPAYDEEQRVTLEDAKRPSAPELQRAADDAMLEAIEEEPASMSEPDELETSQPDDVAPLASEPTRIQPPPSMPIAGEAEPALETSEDDAPSLEVDLDDGPTDDHGAEASGGDEASSEQDRAEELAAEEAVAEAAEVRPVAPVVGVIVQRVVAVVSAPKSSSIPPPPPPDDVESAAEARPAGEPTVDLDEEPELRVADHEGSDLEELDVDLDDGEHGAEAAGDPEPRARDSAPELPTEEAEELLEVDEAQVADAKKRPSKPPPPPASKSKEMPPPKPEPRAEPPPEAAKGEPPRRKKARKQWWEELFNDDYLRTVPIPHPRIIQRQCDFIEQRFGLAQGATILDVGCGLGLHAVELTRRGYLVVGLDLSLPMLSRAADEAQDHGFKINFLHADMREMNFDGAFDAVICYGTTFGYFDDETNKQVVERLHRALKPRGLLLLDVVNRDFVIRNQPNLVWFEGDGCVVMEESQMNYITSRLEVKRTVILDDGRQRDNVYSLRTYSLHELGQILHHQRFRVLEVTGWEAHPGVFFGGDSPKLIILAERRPMGPPTPPGRSPSGEMSTTGSDPAPAPSDALEEEAQAPEESGVTELPDPSERAEPSEAVSEALAEALERSGELELPPQRADEELEAEELAEDELEEDVDASKDD